MQIKKELKDFRKERTQRIGSFQDNNLKDCEVSSSYLEVKWPSSTLPTDQEQVLPSTYISNAKCE